MPTQWISVSVAAALAGVTRGAVADAARRGRLRFRWSPPGRWPRTQAGREVELTSVAAWSQRRAERIKREGREVPR
jgi:hypothetical protein